MKKILFSMLFLISIYFVECKCRMGKNTMYVPYNTIEVSKEKGVFLADYLPQDSVIKIGGKNFNIQEAWVEHPHYEKDFGDEVISGLICVMTVSMSQIDFAEVEWRKMDLHHYIKEYGYGNSRIWFYLAASKEEINDTIVVNFRYPSNSYEKKGFMLFKKK